jgi:hypothetical protein
LITYDETEVEEIEGIGSAEANKVHQSYCQTDDSFSQHNHLVLMGKRIHLEYFFCSINIMEFKCLQLFEYFLAVPSFYSYGLKVTLAMHD